MGMVVRRSNSGVRRAKSIRAIASAKVIVMRHECPEACASAVGTKLAVEIADVGDFYVASLKHCNTAFGIVVSYIYMNATMWARDSHSPFFNHPACTRSVAPKKRRRI
jgi:hypothetical protein